MQLAALAEGDLAGCEQQLGEAIRLDPQNSRLCASRSMVNLKLDRLDRAIHDAELAIKIAPEEPQANGGVN